MVIAYQNPGDKTQLYNVRMKCGHVEQRRMRPATAGIPWVEGATIDAPTAECKVCRDAKQAAAQAAQAARVAASFKVGETVRSKVLGERWTDSAQKNLSRQIGVIETIKADVGFEGKDVLSALVGFDPPLPALDDRAGGQPVTGFWFLLSELEHPTAADIAEARRNAEERATLAEMNELAEKISAIGGECSCGKYGLFTVELADGRVFTKAGIHGRGGVFRLGEGCPTQPERLLADVQRLFIACKRANRQRSLTIYLAHRYCGGETLTFEPEEIRKVSIEGVNGNLYAFEL